MQAVALWVTLHTRSRDTNPCAGNCRLGNSLHTRNRRIPPVNRGVRSLLIVGGAYFAAQMMADIASLRIIEVGGWAVDAGTLIYPFTFTLRDLVHKIAGKSAARTLIFLAAGINLFMAGFFWLVAVSPDQITGPQLEFGSVLAPVWGIVARLDNRRGGRGADRYRGIFTLGVAVRRGQAVGPCPVQQCDSDSGRLGDIRRPGDPLRRLLAFCRLVDLRGKCGVQGGGDRDLDPLDLLGPTRAAGGDLRPKWALM